MGENGRFFGEGLLKPIRVKKHFSLGRIFTDCLINGFPDPAGQTTTQLVIDKDSRGVRTLTRGINLLSGSGKSYMVIREVHYPSRGNRINFKEGKIIGVFAPWEEGYSERDNQMRGVAV